MRRKELLVFRLVLIDTFFEQFEQNVVLGFVMKMLLDLLQLGDKLGV